MTAPPTLTARMVPGQREKKPGEEVSRRDPELGVGELQHPQDGEESQGDEHAKEHEQERKRQRIVVNPERLHGGSGESGTAGAKRLESVRAELSPGSSAPATMLRRRFSARACPERVHLETLSDRSCGSNARLR